LGDEIQEKQLHPYVKNRFEFWGAATLMKPMDLKKEAIIKLKTQGNSIFIESCSLLKEHAASYSGEDVLGGWTSKIHGAKQNNQTEKPIPGDDKQGADASEWD